MGFPGGSDCKEFTCSPGSSVHEILQARKQLNKNKNPDFLSFIVLLNLH